MQYFAVRAGCIFLYRKHAYSAGASAEGKYSKQGHPTMVPFQMSLHVPLQNEEMLTSHPFATLEESSDADVNKNEYGAHNLSNETLFNITTGIPAQVQH